MSEPELKALLAGIDDKLSKVLERVEKVIGLLEGLGAKPVVVEEAKGLEVPEKIIEKFNELTDIEAVLIILHYSEGRWLTAEEMARESERLGRPLKISTLTKYTLPQAMRGSLDSKVVDEATGKKAYRLNPSGELRARRLIEKILSK